METLREKFKEWHNTYYRTTAIEGKMQPTLDEIFDWFENEKQLERPKVSDEEVCKSCANLDRPNHNCDVCGGTGWTVPDPELPDDMEIEMQLTMSTIAAVPEFLYAYETGAKDWAKWMRDKAYIVINRYKQAIRDKAQQKVSDSDIERMARDKYKLEPFPDNAGADEMRNIAEINAATRLEQKAFIAGAKALRDMVATRGDGLRVLQTERKEIGANNTVIDACKPKDDPQPNDKDN